MEHIIELKNMSVAQFSSSTLTKICLHVRKQNMVTISTPDQTFGTYRYFKTCEVRLTPSSNCTEKNLVEYLEYLVWLFESERRKIIDIFSLKKRVQILMRETWFVVIGIGSIISIIK